MRKTKRILVYRTVWIISLMSLFLSCGSDDDAESDKLPECINEKIENIKSQKVWNPPAEVWRWEVDGNNYYYFTSNCCDQFNILYDENCKRVCAPDGGFTGGGDGMCPEFEGEIKKTLVWSDARE